MKQLTRPMRTKTRSISVRLTPDEHSQLIYLSLSRKISVSKLLVDSALATASLVEIVAFHQSSNPE